MTHEDFQAMLTATRAGYQPAEGDGDLAAGDVVTVTLESGETFAVWRLEAESWVRCGTISADPGARAWNAHQMERFWQSRSGPYLQLGYLPQEPPAVTGEVAMRTEPAGPVESVRRVLHLVWLELHGDSAGYQPLWCDVIDVRPTAVAPAPVTPAAVAARRARGEKRSCTVVQLGGSARALRWGVSR